MFWNATLNDWDTSGVTKDTNRTTQHLLVGYTTHFTTFAVGISSLPQTDATTVRATRR